MAKKLTPPKPKLSGAELAQLATDGNGRPFVDAVREAEAGDLGAVARVREAVELMPHVQPMFKDLAGKVEQALLSVVAGNPLLKEMFGVRMAELRQELAGPNPTPLEKILAERAALCWLQANYADLIEATSHKKSMTFKEGDYYQRRQDRAHQRFLATVRMLATVRRLAVPVVQVNVATHGGQQVNVANLELRSGRTTDAAEDPCTEKTHSA